MYVCFRSNKNESAKFMDQRNNARLENGQLVPISNGIQEIQIELKFTKNIDFL